MQTKQTKEQFVEVMTKWVELRKKIKDVKEYQEQAKAREESTSKHIKPWTKG